MTDSPKFLPAEIPVRLLVGAVLYREREVLEVSRRALSLETEKVFSEYGKFGIKPTVIERIENGSGACHAEHLYSLCTALRNIGATNRDKEIREYASKITPGYVYAEVDRHVEQMKSAGLIVVPALDFSGVDSKDVSSLSKQIYDELRPMVVHAICISPWAWEFNGPKLNYFVWKALEQTIPEEEILTGLKKTDAYMGALRQAISEMSSADPSIDAVERMFAKTRKDMIKMGRPPELDKEEFVSIFRRFADLSFEEASADEEFAGIDIEVFEAVKAVAQYRFGLRDSPVAERADVPDYFKEKLLNSEFLPTLVSL